MEAGLGVNCGWILGMPQFGTFVHHKTSRDCSSLRIASAAVLVGGTTVAAYWGLWWKRRNLTSRSAPIQNTDFSPPQTNRLACNSRIKFFHPTTCRLNLFTIVTGHGVQRRRDTGQSVRQPADEAAVEVPASVSLASRTGPRFHRPEGGGRRPRSVPHSDCRGQVFGPGASGALDAGRLVESQSFDRHRANRRHLCWADLLQLPARIPANVLHAVGGADGDVRLAQRNLPPPAAHAHRVL